jgi:myo-inositol-1(or 4)-monophosphatase
MMDLKRLPPERVPSLLRRGGFRSQRNLGAVALEWCWLAAGRFQLYLHGGQKLWDYAAGRLIADEAGVPSRLYRRYGTEPAEGLDLGSRLAVAAANQDLLERWLAFIQLPLTPNGTA